MVRAQLAGLKTQTRRICKPAMEQALSYVVSIPGADAWGDEEGLGTSFHCPYGKPGDLLWVRETASRADKAEDGYVYESPIYRADITDPHGLAFVTADGPRYVEQLKWRPSIHMPRAWSRLTNRLTAVRVERLQDISEEDAEAEGVGEHNVGCSAAGRYECRCGEDSYKDSYAKLWDYINGAGSWAANPWVWVLSFEVIRENVDVVAKRLLEAQKAVSEIGRAVQQECRDRSRMPSSA
eukprot:TRINITY_DN13522_c0_g1_i3.p1 TRINITY_DN13522_c0_g1~~TRINITY_DN13522_c0_g1_i3.p1  ORF type:complete len:238 (+),score=54.01 TRINITY_DN13522_c0_g1_i3:626-1339(+)